ncbi:DUF418 domain-containing protein [Brevundimonas kwangchunensis]|uniref:DUF418 domain-containing protein n=2 Tax=Brevundimonas kwangchunensis TaxID=322163 RepID=A0ABN1GZT3_9CAUL
MAWGGRMVPVAERLVLLDTLRAIALFGVIVMNITAMVMIFKAPAVLAAAGPVDLGIGLFDLVFLQGKARSAFAFLFGVGFGILMQRAQARGAGFGAFYLRRMLILLGIGAANLAFLYWGDILIVYALLGMVLLLFRNASQRLLLALGLALILAPPLFAGMIEAVTGAPLPSLAGMTPGQVEAGYGALAPAYLSGDYMDFICANLRYYLLHNVGETGPVIVYDLGVLGLFMLGVWAARRGLFEDIERHRPVLRRLVWIALPLGLLLSAVHATRRLGLPVDGVVYGVVSAAYMGLPIMAFGYLAALTLYINRKGQWLTRLLAPMGRMALTGYLASNAIGSFVWYAWGLGRINDVAWLTTLVMNGLAIAVFVGLCVFSAVWLRVFRFGPAEWVWRSLTYGQPQPMRRAAP